MFDKILKTLQTLQQKLPNVVETTRSQAEEVENMSEELLGVRMSEELTAKFIKEEINSKITEELKKVFE
jgi:hypothetical protein